MDRKTHQGKLSRPFWRAGSSARLNSMWTKVVHAWWLWEVAAAIVLIVATIALIVVLKTADQQQQRPWLVGNTQLTLNTVIAIVSIIMRASLLVMVGGALNQSPWNEFAQRKQSNQKQQVGHPLKDLDLFGEAANGSWGSLKLLCRTKFRYGPYHSIVRYASFCNIEAEDGVAEINARKEDTAKKCAYFR